MNALSETSQEENKQADEERSYEKQAELLGYELI